VTTSRSTPTSQLAYAEVLATKVGPLQFLSLKNEAKNKPIDRPHLATWLDVSERANNFEAGRCNHFGCANIDLPGEHSPAESS
jgi:hypothetical protein